VQDPTLRITCRKLRDGRRKKENIVSYIHPRSSTDILIAGTLTVETVLVLCWKYGVLPQQLPSPVEEARYFFGASTPTQTKDYFALDANASMVTATDLFVLHRTVFIATHRCTLGTLGPKGEPVLHYAETADPQR
jgi:hypothetical protein